MAHIVLLLLFACISGIAAEYFSPDLYSALEALAPLCKGLDNVRVGNPTDCQKFVVCCKGEALGFVCHLPPTPGYQIYEYSPSFSRGAATYDPMAGHCVSTPAPKDCGPNVLNQVPSTAMCKARAAVEAREGPITLERLRPVKMGALGTFTTGKNTLGLSHSVTASRSHIGRLLAVNMGSWSLIKNGQTGKSSTGALAIHAILVPGTDKILTATRPLDWPNDRPKLPYEPGMTPTNGLGELSSLFDTTTGTYVVQPINTSPFCMAHVHLQDGTILTAGGDPPTAPGKGVQPQLEGRNVIRRWTINDKWQTSQTTLAGFHWYPTMLTLPDQRVIITNGVSDPDRGTVQPLFEVYDPATDKIVYTSKDTPMSTFKLYPALFLLPWQNTVGQYMLYAFDGCTQGIVMTMDKNNNVQKYRSLPSTYDKIGKFCSQSSAQGTATLLMLKPSNGYAAEVVQFGGFAWTNGETCYCNNPACPWSIRAKLDKNSVNNNQLDWVAERMPRGRVGVDSVVLPNGKVILVNGAEFGQQQGSNAGGGQSRNAVLSAWLYDPDAPVNQRYQELAASKILRYYHSTALLLPDASVLVAGSEESDCQSDCPVAAPALVQYQAEKYKPYYFDSPARPKFVPENNPTTGATGNFITVRYQGTATYAVLAAPAAVTHQLNMNQRVIRLNLKVTGQVGAITVARVTLPPNGLVAPKGWYMLFVMNGDIPCEKAVWFRLT